MKKLLASLAVVALCCCGLAATPIAVWSAADFDSSQNDWSIDTTGCTFDENYVCTIGTQPIKIINKTIAGDARSSLYYTVVLDVTDVPLDSTGALMTFGRKSTAGNVNSNLIGVMLENGMPWGFWDGAKRTNAPGLQTALGNETTRLTVLFKAGGVSADNGVWMFENGNNKVFTADSGLRATMQVNQINIGGRSDNNTMLLAGLKVKRIAVYADSSYEGDQVMTTVEIPENLRILDSVPASADRAEFQDSSWTGTVWLKNVTWNDWDFGSLGNANSRVRLTGVKGYGPKAALTECAPTVELVDSEMSAALTQNNGYSVDASNNVCTYQFAKLVGTGTLDASPSRATPQIRIVDASNFRGNLTASVMRVAVGNGTTATAGGKVTIEEGASLTIAAGKSVNAVAGAGTLVLPDFTTSTGVRNSLKNEAWTGTVEIGPSAVTAQTQIFLADYGHADSKIVLKGLAGSGGRYLPSNCHIKSDVRVDGAVGFNQGSSNANYYFDGTVSGAGNLTFANWRGNDGFGSGYHIAKLKDYTGTLTTSRATTIDVLDLAELPANDTKVVNMSNASEATIRVSKLTINGEDAPTSAAIEVRTDGLYYVDHSDLETEETTAVSGHATINYLHIGSTGVETIDGVGGVKFADLAIAEGGKLVVDPVKTPLYALAKPVLNGQLKLAAAHDECTLGKFTLLTWAGDSLGLTLDELKALVDVGDRAYTVEEIEPAGIANHKQLILKLGAYDAEAKTIRVMPLGDSITEGTNQYEEFARPNYRVNLMAKLEAKGYKAISCGYQDSCRWNSAGLLVPEEHRWHCGMSGQECRTEGAAGWEDSIDVAMDAAGEMDYVTFKIGTNDMKDGNYDEIKFRTSWANVLTKIHHARPNAKIICATVVDTNGNNDRTHAFNEYVKEFVKTQTIIPAGQLSVADLNAACPRQSDGVDNFADGLHPNWVGHDRTSNCWLEAILAAEATVIERTEPTYTTSVDSATNVPSEYLTGFRKIATFTPTATGKLTMNATAAEIYGENLNVELADKKFSKVGYYVALKRRNVTYANGMTVDYHGHVRYIWVDMDAFGDRSLAEIGVPLKSKVQQVATNIHVYSNDTGIRNVPATTAGVKGFVEFWPYSYSGNASDVEGAPANRYNCDWNDTVNLSGAYGSMQVHRIFEAGESWNEGEVLFAFNRFTANNRNEIGIGSCAQKISSTSIDYTFTEGLPRLSAEAYEVMSIEIWGIPECQAIAAGETSEEMDAEPTDEQLAAVEVAAADEAAAAAGQAALLKAVKRQLANGKWVIAVELDPEKVASIEAALTAFAGSALQTIALSTAPTTITLPKTAVTSGVYYSVVYGADVKALTGETTRVLAAGEGDVVIQIPAMAGAKVQFFRIRASAKFQD